MINESIGIFSINKNVFVGLFLLCMFCLLSLRVVQSFISLGASSLLAFASIYYCIGLVVVSSLCLVVCAIVDLTCSSQIDYAESVIGKRVDSESSAASENFARVPENDDHFALKPGSFKVSRNVFLSLPPFSSLTCRIDHTLTPNTSCHTFVPLQESLANEVNAVHNLTSSYFEHIEETCESLSAAATYCLLALCLSLIAVGGQIMALIDMRQRAFGLNGPRKDLERQTQAELLFEVT